METPRNHSHTRRGGGEEEEDNDPPYAIAKTKVLRTPTKKGEGARRRAVKLPP